MAEQAVATIGESPVKELGLSQSARQSIDAAWTNSAESTLDQVFQEDTHSRCYRR